MINNLGLLVYGQLVLLLPLIFSIQTNEAFEFNKLVYIYGSALFVLFLLFVKKVMGGTFKKMPLLIPFLAFILSQILSTIFSIERHTSIFGYYSRFNGGLLSVFAFSVLLYGLVQFVQKKQLPILLGLYFFGAVLSAGYAFPEHFGASPSCKLLMNEWSVKCWVQDVQNRVFGTMGQPNWLAAYLLPALILLAAEGVSLVGAAQTASADTKKKVQYAGFLSGGGILAAFCLILAVLFFTKSRSGLVGLAAGMAVYTVLLFLFEIRRKQIQWKRVLLAFLVFTILSGAVLFTAGRSTFDVISQTAQRYLPFLHLQQQEQTAPEVKLAGTQLETGGTESGEIRKIVWRGAINVWKRYPLFGSGVETFGYSYYRDRPIEHNLVSEWDFLYNKAHNEILNYLATTGLFGLGAYLVFHTSVLLWSLRKLRKLDDFAGRNLGYAAVASILSLHLAHFFGFSTVATQWTLILLIGVLFILNIPDHIDTKLKSLSLERLLFIALAVFVLYVSGQYLTTYWKADVFFSQAKRSNLLQTPEETLQSYQDAITSNPNEATYHDGYAAALQELTLAYSQNKPEGVDEKQLKEMQTKLGNQALEESLRSITINPRQINFYKTRVSILTKLSSFDPTMLDSALDVLQHTRVLAPTDPKLVFQTALIYEAQMKYDESIKAFEEALRLKPNYQQAIDELNKITAR